MRAAARAAGIDPTRISTHSPRVGMAQDLVAWAIDMPGLMQAGRWKTPTTAARYTQHLAAHHTP
ncbi:MAG: tyrosine-type recombinase/integrase, partial [Acidimicrobiia bacterium]|nr:tyrosine-type recombinase/integrase [Acidimicrobiia bacterium]